MIIKRVVIGLLFSLLAVSGWAESGAKSASVESSVTSRSNSGAADAVAGRWPAVIYTGMRSSDLDRSLHFYTEVLGMSELRRVNKGEDTEVILGFSGDSARAGVLLMHTRGDDRPVEHGDTEAKIVLGMANVDAIAERMKVAGFKDIDLRQHSRAKILIIRDPDGYKYEIIDITAVKDGR